MPERATTRRPRCSAQATRSPRLQTPRSSGVFPAGLTRIRSPRRPVSRLPRSSRPAARAGLSGRHRGDVLGHHLQSRGRRAATALELQQIFGHRPTVIDVADDVGLGHPHFVEEHLVLDFFARRHHQRTNLDSRSGHVDEHEGDTTLLLVAAAGAHEREHPIGFPRMGGPDLAAGADQVVTVVAGGHRQRRQVRPGLWFGVALTEEHLTREDAGQEIVLLFVGAELDDRVGHHPDTHRGQRRCPRELRLPAENVVLGQAPVATAVSDRPGRCGPALFVQDALPLHAGVVVGVHARHQLASASKLRRQLLGEKGAHLVAEREIGGRPLQIHRFPFSCAGSPTE